MPGRVPVHHNRFNVGKSVYRKTQALACQNGGALLPWRRLLTAVLKKRLAFGLAICPNMRAIEDKAFI